MSSDDDAPPKEKKQVEWKAVYPPPQYNPMIPPVRSVNAPRVPPPQDNPMIPPLRSATRPRVPPPHRRAEVSPHRDVTLEVFDAYVRVLQARYEPHPVYHLFRHRAVYDWSRQRDPGYESNASHPLCKALPDCTVAMLPEYDPVQKQWRLWLAGNFRAGVVLLLDPSVGGPPTAEPGPDDDPAPPPPPPVVPVGIARLVRECLDVDCLHRVYRLGCRRQDTAADSGLVVLECAEVLLCTTLERAPVDWRRAAHPIQLDIRQLLPDDPPASFDELRVRLRRAVDPVLRGMPPAFSVPQAVFWPLEHLLRATGAERVPRATGHHAQPPAAGAGRPVAPRGAAVGGARPVDGASGNHESLPRPTKRQATATRGGGPAARPRPPPPPPEAAASTEGDETTGMNGHAPPSAVRQERSRNSSNKRTSPLRTQCPLAKDPNDPPKSIFDPPQSRAEDSTHVGAMLPVDTHHCLNRWHVNGMHTVGAGVFVSSSRRWCPMSNTYYFTKPHFDTNHVRDLGLFSNLTFLKGDWITAYDGKLITEDDVRTLRAKKEHRLVVKWTYRFQTFYLNGFGDPAVSIEEATNWPQYVAKYTAHERYGEVRSIDADLRSAARRSRDARKENNEPKVPRRSGKGARARERYKTEPYWNDWKIGGASYAKSVEDDDHVNKRANAELALYGDDDFSCVALRAIRPIERFDEILPFRVTPQRTTARTHWRLKEKTPSCDNQMPWVTRKQPLANYVVRLPSRDIERPVVLENPPASS